MKLKLIATTLALFAGLSMTSAANAQMDTDMPDHPEALGQGMQPPPPGAPAMSLTAVSGQCPVMPGGPGCPVMGHHHWMHNDLGDLRLTDEQYEKLYQIHRAQLAKTATTRSDLMQAELDLHDQMLTAQPDRNKIMATAKRIADLKSSLEMAKVEMSLDTLAALTPEQRMQLRKGMLHKFANSSGMLRMH